jgi:hypothetical protein
MTRMIFLSSFDPPPLDDIIGRESSLREAWRGRIAIVLYLREKGLA